MNRYKIVILTFGRRCIETFFFVTLGGSLYAQGLVTSSEKLERLHREDEVVQNSKYFAFLGFRPTAFETSVESDESSILGRWAEWRTRESGIKLELQYLSIHERPVTLPAFGSTEFPVYFSSLLAGSQGLDVPYGENAVIGAGLNLRPLKWLHLFGEIQGAANFIRGGWYHLPQAYAELQWKKLVFSIGRKPVYWGQSFIAPTIWSDNATSLDALQLTTIPQRGTWLFKYFGLMKTEVFFSRMNADRVPAHDYFVGWRVGMTPFDLFELNGAMIYQFGGNGIDTGSLSDTVIEIFGGRGNKGSGPDDSSNVTNRAFEADFRFHFSDWAWPSSFYSELHVEDCCGSYFLPGQKSISYTFGAYVRAGQSLHNDRWRAEFTRTSPKTYYHTTWPSAFTNEGRIVGHPLGRDGLGAYVNWQHEFQQWAELQSQLGWEYRDHTALVDRSNIRVVRPDFAKPETRLLIFEELRKPISEKLFLTFSGGFVRVLHKEDMANRNTNEWGTSLSLSRTY